MNEMIARVRDFIVGNFYVPPGQSLDPKASLLDHGIVDSTGVLEVIGWIEREFGIVVEDREMVPANLDSIHNIAIYVTRKVGDSPADARGAQALG